MPKFLEAASLWIPSAIMLGLAAMLIGEGSERLSLSFLVMPPEDMGRAGGIGPLIVNTLLVVAGAMSVAVPLSLSTALAYAASPGGAWRRTCRSLIDVGLCLPRLLWGLAGATIFCGALDMGLSMAAGVLTLAALISPILVTSFIDVLQQVEARLGTTCRALGMTELSLWSREILAAARPGLAAGCLLASGRACGDAAALFLTAGLGTRIAGSLMDPASTLAVHIFVLVSDVGGGEKTAFAAAVVLLALMSAIQMPFVRGSWTVAPDRR